MARTPTALPIMPRWRLAVCALVLAASASSATAQSDRYYYPLTQDVPPGVAGQWAATIRPGLHCHFQNIQVDLPGGGVVTFFAEHGTELHPQAAPAQVELQVGPVYRLKIGGMEEFPGVELYPTVELISRLHPPPGKAPLFPVPIAFTTDEIRLALQGSLITKVIYLEQPDLARPEMQSEPVPTIRVTGQTDALRTADELGRPMAIVRLGGRLPPAAGQPSDFYGRGAPLRVVPLPLRKPAGETGPTLQPAHHKKTVRNPRP